MNPTEPSNITTSVANSTTRLPVSYWVTAYSFQGTFGLTGVVTNIQLLTVLWACRKTTLNTKSYVIIGNLAIADLFVGASFTGFTVRRIYCVLRYGKACVVTQFKCALIGMPSLLGINASMVFSFVLAVDRILAAAKPVWYRKVAKSSVWMVIRGVWAFILVEVLMMLAEPSNTKNLPRCTIVAGVSESYYAWSSSYSLALTAITVLLYFGLIIATKFRSKGAVAPAGQSTGDKREASVEAKVTKSIQLIIFVYISTAVTSRIVYWGLSFLPKKDRSQFGVYARNLQIVNSAVNFFILMGTNSSFRKGWVKLFLGGKLNFMTSTTHKSAASQRQSSAVRF